MPEPSAADRQPVPPPAMAARISKEDINLLPLGSWEGPVVVVQRVDDLEPALARLTSADKAVALETIAAELMVDLELDAPE